MSRSRQQRHDIPKRYSATGRGAFLRDNTSGSSGRVIPQGPNILQRLQQFAIPTPELIARKCRIVGFGVRETLL